MVDLIPRELLFGNPRRVMPRLSPDGGTLGYLAPEEGVLNVWVRTVGGKDDRAVTHDRGRGIRSYAFAEDGRHILFEQDRDGDENWHVFRVPREGGEAVDLTPLDGVQARLVAVEPRHPGTILVGLNDRDPRLHDVHRIDLETGERTLALENTVGAVDWVADHELRVRVAQVPTAEGGFVILHRNDEGDEWRELLAVPAEDALCTGIEGFAGDDRTLYLVTSKGANAGELRSLDTRTGEMRVLASDPSADVVDMLSHPETHVAQAALFARDRREWRVLDPAVEADLAAIRALNPGDALVVDRDRKDRLWITAHQQDRGPILYHVWNRALRKASFLFAHRPELTDQPLAEMKPVSFTARDGLTIHGYLTLPPGAGAGPHPAVLNVHGGPWARDDWGFHPEAQWLANRGYVCLQVNFRGSTGYGKEFLNAGDREWGGKMQDDITDAARWLIDRGLADPSRIGIYGGSYGGFAVLSGLTKTPELFACGVDIVGPSNLLTFIRSIPPYWEPLKVLFARRVGDVETEEEFLRSRSPLFAVDRIRAPLLIVQGKNDPRVNREESLQIVDALRAAGKTVEYLEFEDEGHGFARPENRLAFYAAAERFLAKHLGGRFEPEEGVS